MAFNAATEWDVRVTGNDANGGGFQVGSSGTDFSQQDAPQHSYTDLVIDGATNTKITSAARPFSSVDVGNVINITGGAGFTVQRVQIVSVASAVATCDKAVGTIGSTGGAGNLGGALATVGAAAALAIAGNTIHVKAGTYTVTTSMTVTGGLTIATRTAVIGYGSTHRDGGTRPLITTATNSTPLFLCTTSNNLNLQFENLSLSNTAAIRANGIGDPGGGGARTTYVYISDCLFDGFAAAVGDSNSNYRLSVSIRRSEIKNCTTNGISARADLWTQDCFLHDNAGSILWTPNGIFVLTILNSLIVDGTGIGVNVATPGAGPNRVYIVGSTIARHSSDGVRNANACFFYILNCILYGNGEWGATNSVTIPIVDLTHLAYGANSSGNLSGFTASPSDVALTADPFTNAADDDYSLNNVAGGGAACRGAGYQWGA